MTNNKEKYKKFCDNHIGIPLFLRYNWYAKLFNDKDWGVVIEEKNNEIIGFSPYVLYKKLIYKLILPPYLTPYNGIWLSYSEDQKYTNRLSYEKTIISSLIDKLPNVDVYKQKFFPEFTNWLPFYWKGYQQTTKYTYILQDISNHDKIFNDFRENIRREIRKAEKQLTISVLDDVQLFYDLNLKSYQVKGIKYPFSFLFIDRLYKFCLENKCGELLVAKDADGNVHSVILYVWDDASAYYLHGVTNPDFKSTGSMSLLLWESIKRSSNKTNQFNFEGSMIEPIERYFRAFGGKQTPYFEISKTSAKTLKLFNY